MATRNRDSKPADILQDWREEDTVDRQARDQLLKSLDAQRDRQLDTAGHTHDAKLRELSTGSELYPAQKELIDKGYEEEKKGILEAHAKETSRVSAEYDQKLDTSTRAMQSQLDADFNAPPLPPERKDGGQEKSEEKKRDDPDPEKE
jgi:hypothetical protein